MEAAPKASLRIGDTEFRFLVDETQGSGDLVVFEFTAPANTAVIAPPHYHVSVDEMVYGLEGIMTSTVNGKAHQIKPGESLFIPRGVVHHHANLHAERVRSLGIMNPGTIGRRYFEEIAQVVNVPGKPDLAEVKNIMLRYGLVPA